MGIFKRKDDRDTSQKAASRSLGFRAALARTLGDREGKTTPNAVVAADPCSGNSSASSSHLVQAGLEGGREEDEACGNDLSSSGTQSLWDRAYHALRVDKAHQEVVRDYEKLLSKESERINSLTNIDARQRTVKTTPVKDASQDADTQSHQARLESIIENGLEEMDQRCEYLVKKHVSGAAKLALWAKGFIGEAVKASPEASIAWAGVCIVLPLLTNPQTADQGHRDGLAYITMRVRYCAALEPMLLRLVENPGVDDNVMEVTMVGLYRHILEFQIRTVLRLHENSFKKYAKDVYDPKFWQEKTDKIETLVAEVSQILTQINDLAERQELETLNKTSHESLINMRQLLSVSERHLSVAEQSLAHSEETVQLMKDGAKERLTEKEKMCHQVFRLADGSTDDTYEWYKGRVEDSIEGTCQWFLSHENFKRWLEQDSGPLLVSADPGCGNSVLAKRLIDHELPRSSTICYFFFKDQDQNTTLNRALCALLHQLFSDQPALIQHAIPEYDRNGSGLVNVRTSLWSILRAAARDPQAKPIIVVLDALDECAEGEFEELMKSLREQFHDGKLSSGKTKYLLTSRPYETIVSAFRGLLKDFPYIRIPGEKQSDAISEEVNLVIAHRADQLATDKGLPKSLRDILVSKLCKTPQRTYLWVYLLFDHLETEYFKKTPKGIEFTISKLPKTVNEAYEKMLQKSKDNKAARKALSILLAAREPLTVAEMNCAINADELDLEQEDAFEASLRSWCGLLVSIYHRKVYFLHQTAREFLLAEMPETAAPSSWHGSISMQDAHAVLAGSCVAYLENFNRDSDALDAHSTADRRTAFLPYSASAWGDHCRDGLTCVKDNAPMVSSILRICDPQSKSFSAWIPLGWEQPSHEDRFESLSCLMIACYFGLYAVVKQALIEGDDIEATDQDYLFGFTPLLWAIHGGEHESIVQHLLANNANTEARDQRGRTPLLWAARKGHESTVQHLIANNANTEARDQLERTPLLWAAAVGHESTVKYLLTNNADIEAKDANSSTPLIVSIRESGSNELQGLVMHLLAKGANFEAKYGDGQTALHHAAQEGEEGIVQQLLARGADIEAKCKDGRTALHYAAGSGFEVVVQQLLARGADVEAKAQDEEGIPTL
ncbi:hypothetical protein Daus18300_012396 [Diaporthe australafricana]|uniref:NWD NACHT-NTPase N-terminal domain-containing protein n=1 Tax=Diaporthe australafricana TaxID=127596 RepID=A0ABR3W2X1_9PEZI